jgi:predicted nucleotidyltransferase
MLTQKIKEQIVSRIVHFCGNCTVYLFGSYAYGNPTESSDVDIAVIMDQVESKVEQAAKLWNELKDIPFPKDIVVASQEEFEFYKNECGSIFKTIAEKGVILHG